MNETTLCRLTEINKLSDDISTFRFESLGKHLSGLEPGAHIDVHLDENLVRQYSIWDWSADGLWCSIAVKREDAGRGGSVKMHQLKTGDEIEIGGPRNNFKLEETDCHYTLVAGGIGVTPLYAMAHRLKTLGADFRIFYLVQTRKMAAFNTQFEDLDLGDCYHLHCDDVNGILDLAEVLGQVPANGEVYACGPEPMLDALLASSAGMRSGNIHFERFSAANDIPHDPNQTFEIEIKSTGDIYTIGKQETILSVLQQHNINIDFGCSEGLCGSCQVDVLEGEIDHRDDVLTPEEQQQNDFMYVCVSRAKSRRLVLDL